MLLSLSGSFLARPKPAALRAALAGAVLAALSTPGAAQAYKLNSPFELEAITGDVRDFRVKFNGNFVFFRADERRTGVVELFTVPALGGAQPFRENRWLVQDRSVVAFEPSPAGNWITFVADQDADDRFELYSRRPGDTKPRKLSGTMPAFGDVSTIAVTPDASRVVYLADAETDSRLELFSVPIDGSGTPVKISGTQAGESGILDDFLLSPTSARVLYFSDQDGAGLEFELYSAPVDGSAAPVKLNGPFPPGAGFPVFTPPQYTITSDGLTVVYCIDQDVTGVRELFRVPIDGSAAPTQINPALVAGGDVLSFLLSPDGQRVVYAADQTADNVFDVWSVPLDGSAAPVRLNSPVETAEAVAISPDSSRVVLDANLGTTSKLQGVAIDGSTAPQELDSIPGGGQFLDVAVSPDSQRVVYRTGSGCAGGCTNVASLRSVPIDGSASAVRLDPQTATFFVLDEERGVPFAISSDSTRVVFHWGNNGPGSVLYSAPIGGGSPVGLASGRVSRAYALSPTTARAFFTADLTGGEVFELYSVGSVSGAGLVKLSGALARDTAADVFTPTNLTYQAFRIDSSGEHAVYSADPSVDQDFELFGVRTDGQGGAVALNQDREVRRFEISPDGERTVFLFEEDAAHASFGELFSVPVDGSASPVELNHVLPPQHVVLDFQFSWDGARVVYRAGTLSNSGLWSAPIAGGASAINIVNNLELYAVSPSGNRVVFTRFQNLPGWSLGSAPLDGSAAPVTLDADGPHEFRIVADGSRVVYRSGVDGRMYSVPMDGSASPVLISGAITPLETPVLSPDGAWAVFAGDETGGLTELWGVPSDGSSAPVRLSGTMVTSGDVFTNFVDCSALVSVSNRVVYVADQDTDGVYELYSAPVDGSASPVKLNGALVTGGDVFVDMTVSTRHVRISPDGARVVYVADQDTDGVHELYTVPIDGSAGPVKLNGALVTGGDVSVEFVPGVVGQNRLAGAFQISPDSTRVVYVADQEADGRRELFLAPLDGSLAPRKLNWPLARDGVACFEITPDSRRVLYQATERSLVTELFASDLSFEPVRPHAAPRQHP